MEIGHVGRFSCLENISFEIDVCNLVNLEDLVFVDAFESEVGTLHVDERYDPVASTAEILDKLKVLHRQRLHIGKLVSLRLSFLGGSRS